MGDYIIITLCNLLFYIAGFLVGRHQDKLNKLAGNFEYYVPKIKKKFNDEFLGKKRLGAVSTPTQRDIYLRDHPEEREEIEEMQKAFEELKVKEQ